MKKSAWVGIVLLLGWAFGAQAGMVKYRTPDGREGYASPDLVPAGAIIESSNYQPKSQITSETSAARPVAPPEESLSTPTRGAEARRAELTQERWAKKADRARDDLQKAQRNHDRWLVSCRGVKDLRSLYEVPPGCSDYEKGQLEAAIARLKEAEEWVEDGLYDACRRDDLCLPGYIR